MAGNKEDMMEIRPNIKWHQDLMRSFYSGHFPIYPIESPKMFIRKLFLAQNFILEKKKAFVPDQVFDPAVDNVVPKMSSQDNR